MGKSRREKARPRRADPLAKAVKLPSDPELAALREAQILPVLKDLQKPDAKSRTAAASAVANIVQDAKCRKLLLREQIVPIVMGETLTDTSIDSRAAGWEILKVLAEEEESDFCVHLYRIDILTAIEHAAKSIVETFSATEPPFTKLQKPQQRLIWDIAGSLASLLGVLAAARDDILEAILKPPTILRFLFRLAASKETPRNILEETLLCLITLAEDNLELGQAVINDPETHCYDVLVKYTAGSDMIAALTCGLLHNIFTSLQWHDYSPGKDGASDARLVPVLSRILEQTTFPTGTLNGHEGSGPTETLQAALEVVATIATDFQGVLENGNRAQKQGATSEEWNGFVDEEGNAAAAADAVDGIDEMDIDSEAVGSGPDGDDNEEVDIDEDMTQVTGTGDQPEESTGLDDYPTLRELIQRTVPQLLRVCQKAFEGAGEGVMNIQTRALSALNNLAWTISCIDFSNGENPDILKSWTPAADRIWSKVITPILDTDSADLELATVVTGLAWALSRTLAGNTPAKGGEHRKFISLYRASRNPVPAKQSGGGDQQLFDPLQNVTVKCVGVLGQLARDPAPLDRNREVGIFLTTVLASDDVAPADRIEALNQFFDIYGDENAICDKEVFWREGLLKHVEEAAPKFRAMARKIDKRKEQELRMRADEALLNLGRFIKYKKKHAPKEGLV